MKNFLLYLMSFGLLLGGLSGCSSDNTDPDPDPTPAGQVTFTAKSGEVTYSTIQVSLTTAGISRYAYLATPKAEAAATAPTATIIFATGTEATCADGTSTFTVNELDPNTDYYIYIAGAVSGKEAFYDTVLTVQANTAAFSDELVVYDVDHSSFRVHVPFKPTKTDGSTVIRWALADMLTYNYRVSQRSTDATFLGGFSDEFFHTYITEDADFIFDEYHSIVRDENGEPIVGDDGAVLTYWNPIVAGQPQYLLLGEFAEGESENGWGMGWYSPLFDADGYYAAIGGGGIGPWKKTRADAVDQADFWTGYYHKELITANKPAEFPEKITVDKSGLKPNGGVLRLTIPDGLEYVCLAPSVGDEWDIFKESLLNGDESLMQWAVTSFNAMYIMGAQMYQITGDGGVGQNIELGFDDFFYEYSQNTPYYFFITGINDQSGSSQTFTKVEFMLPAPTKPAPEIIVAGIDAPEGYEASPYEVWFNIKCPTGDAVKAMYACNYERDWELELNGGSTNLALIESGNAFGAEEIAEINKTAGYNVKFTTRPDANTYLGVVAYNDEGTGNDPDAAGSQAIGKRRSSVLPDKTRVESEFFTALLGDWTLSASYETYGYPDWVKQADPMTCKVTIVDKLTYEATLPEAIYEYYKNNTQYTRDEVTALYEEFKTQTDTYNQRLRGQNRLLCLGLDIDRPQYGDAYLSACKTAYDLFIATTEEYTAGYDVESMFFDYGPKWYLEINADGSVSAPFDTANLAPLSFWNQGAEYYFVGLNSNGYLPNGSFPVTVSDDKNTITVNGIVSESQGTFYPNAAKAFYGLFNISTRICSALTLTSGWSDPAPASVKGGKAVTLRGGDVKRALRPLGRTTFAATKTYTRVKVAPRSKESLEVRMEKALGSKKARR